MRVAMRADSSGSTLTSATTRPGASSTPLASSTSTEPTGGVAAVPGVAPVAGTTESTLTSFFAATWARVVIWSVWVAICSGHDRNAAYP
ncbi:hypothetical protein D3C74_392400 [compost metagenome]